MKESFTIHAEKQRSQEEIFREKLTSLPTELSHRWLSRYEGLNEGDEITFFAEFDGFLRNRNGAFTKTLEVHLDTDETIRDEVLLVHQVIRDTFGDSNYFLGNGRTAEVYQLPIAPHLCVKYIKDQSAYDENNHMRVEYSFLDRLHAFKVAGIRTPHPYFIRIHPHEGHSYGMERIMGESLSRILERPSEHYSLIQVLKKMNPRDVEDRFVSYLKALHKEHKITHNDVAQRNIMVDHDGNFYLIDFGKAKYEEIGEDHEQYQNSDITRVISELRQFFLEIDKVTIH